jgi:hypothetical protein
MDLTKIEQQEKEYLEKYYGELVGAKIIDFSIVAENDYGVNFWPTFIVELVDKQTRVIEISQDPEGNGPGFIFGLSNPSSRS